MEDTVFCCTNEEMQKAVEGEFFFDTVNHNPFEEMGIANITYSDLITDIRNRVNVSESEKFDYPVGKCYDNVWVAALTLNCSLNPMDALDDDSDSMFEGCGGTIIKGSSNTITECLDMLDFVGTSGRIRFEEGALNTVLVLKRNQGATTRVVAYYWQDYSRYKWIEGALIWKDNIIPIDSAFTIQKEKSIPMSLNLTMCVLAGAGIIVTIVCFVFNVVWRQDRIVKMSSPNIHSIILAGCLLLYVTIVIETTATTTKAMCAVRLFCFWIGFAITFGSMLSKTWRVYKMFNNKKMRLNMSIKNKHLLVIIGIVVTMEALVLIVWESFSPHRVTEQQLKTEIVHIDALNDSKTIGICLYNVVILSVVELVLSMMLKDKPVERLGVTSVCLFAGTLVSEILIFLPKMLAVFRNPIATPQAALKTFEFLPPLNIATLRIE